jgi:phage terminase large subunit-like protein
LSDKLDLTCMMVLLPDVSGFRIDCIPFFFTPEDTLEERTRRDRVPYYDWAGQGYLLPVPGKAIDYRFVSRKLIEVCEDFDVQLIVFDRWRIKLFWAAMELEGFSPDSLNWMEHGQGFRDMAPAIDATEEDLLSGRLRHGMHPVLTFNAGCTKVSKDPAGNRKFDKLKSSGKIDGMVALAMGLHAIHQTMEGAGRSVYENRDVISLGSHAIPPVPRDTMPQPTVRRSVWERLDTA